MTEFVPVSSTAHLLLVQRFFGFDDEGFGKTLAVLIRLGALLALLSIYFLRLSRRVVPMFSDPAARQLSSACCSPCWLLRSSVRSLTPSSRTAQRLDRLPCTDPGGAILLWVDQLDLAPRHHWATGFSLPMYFGIGLACLALIPGVSRSGAAIAAAMLLGADRRAALSFWVAMPAMTGAVAYYLYNSYGQMSPNAAMLIAIGFAVSFAAAWLVVKTFLD